MSGAFDYFEILILAMLAVFLIYRLGSALGKRTGHKRRPSDMFPGGQGGAGAAEDSVVSLPGRDEARDEAVEAAMAAMPHGEGLAAIHRADPSFDPQQFLDGARAAFEMVVVAFSQDDEKTLRNLLSDSVFDDFHAAIEDRRSRKEKLETTLVGIDSVEILEAGLEGSDAVLTIKLVSQQANVTYDAEGAVVGGDAQIVAPITDIWTFQRDTRSPNPNWLLVATRSPN